MQPLQLVQLAQHCGKSSRQLVRRKIQFDNAASVIHHDPFPLAQGSIAQPIRPTLPRRTVSRLIKSLKRRAVLVLRQKLIALQPQYFQVRRTVQFSRNSARQPVGGENQPLQLDQLAQRRREGSRQLVIA